MWTNRQARRDRLAFTLIELLVVVTIIALLVALLSPTMNRTKFLTRVQICGSGQRQFITAIGSYAADERGFLPRADTGQSGRNGGNNLWDVHYDIYYRLKDNYGMPHKAFFCSFTDKDHLGADFLTIGWKRYGFALLTYSYWVPRKLSQGLSPPALDDPGGHVIVDTEEFRGPVSTSDPLGVSNPVLTDGIITPGSVGPDAQLASDPSAHGPAFRLHLYHGVLDSTNNVYVDGSVRRIDGRDVRARFFGNWWNWR